MTRHATRQVRRFDRTRLIEAQAAKGLTVEALARELGVGVRLVQRWRAGDGEPAGHNLVVLAEVLGRDARWFYGNTRGAAA